MLFLLYGFFDIFSVLTQRLKKYEKEAFAKEENFCISLETFATHCVAISAGPLHKGF